VVVGLVAGPAAASSRAEVMRTALTWPGDGPLPSPYASTRPDKAAGLKQALLQWCDRKGLKADVARLRKAKVGMARPADPGVFPPIRHVRGNTFYETFMKHAQGVMAGEDKHLIHGAWALTHPQSPLLGEPKLLGPVLDYLEVCTSGKKDIDHQFGLVGPSRIFLLLWRRYPDLVPPSRKQAWAAAFRKLAKNACRRTRYAAKREPRRIVVNLSISDATSIANIAAALGDEELKQHADAVFAGIHNHMWEDGGYNYMTEAMPPPHYHSVLTRTLLEYWLLTGKEVAREQIVRMWWWWPLALRSHDPKRRGIGLDITTVAWKKAGIYQGYNNRACSSAYVVAMVSGSPENVGLPDTQLAIRSGGLEGHEFLGAVIWRPELTGKPLPDRWMVWDRNTQGPNAKFGAFSAHGMVNPRGKLSAVAASGLHCGAQMRGGDLPTAQDQRGRDRYAVWHHQGRSSSSVWQEIGGISGTHRKTTAAIGNLAAGATPFSSSEAWVFTENRLIGLITLRAEQNAEALAMTAAVRIARTKESSGGDLGNGRYGYGPLGIAVHKTSFAPEGRFVEKGQRALEWIDPVAAKQGRKRRSYPAGTTHYILIDCHDRTNTRPATEAELLELSGGLIGFSFNDGRQRIRMIANPQSRMRRYRQRSWPRVRGNTAVVTSGMQGRPAWMDSFVFPFAGALTKGEALRDPRPKPQVIRRTEVELAIPPDGHVILVNRA
jgi:hypothetical protein